MEAEEIFWNWFTAHKAEIVARIEMNETTHEIFSQLNKKLSEYDELLLGEVTKNKNNQYVLVLTCDGRAKGAYPLTKLAHYAPEIEGWTIQQFRKPGLVFELNFEGLELKPSDLKFRHWFENGERFVDVYIPGYSETDKRFQQLAFLYLDHFIGEYEVMTKISSVGFKKLTWLTPQKELIDLNELNKLIHD